VEYEMELWFAVLHSVVDDAHWLDPASARTLAFDAWRLLAERVAEVFAAREPSDALRALPELEVRGLVNGEARAPLAPVVRVPLDEHVQDRIVAETRGLNLALCARPSKIAPVVAPVGSPVSTTGPTPTG
jgi:hypothetical protein